MAKKSFTDNPALQFISGADNQEESHPLKGKAFDRLKKREPEPEHLPDLMQQAEPEGNFTRGELPEGYKLNPKYIEKRTKRIQLVVQPSLYDKLKAAADAAGLSLNEYANQAFKDKLDIKE